MPVIPVDIHSYTDEALLPLLAGGSTIAFNELYSRYGQRMFAFFYRLLWKNKELAEDQVQELFLKLVKHAGSFDKEKSFSTWLYSIANNMCKNEYRKAETRSKHVAAVKSNTSVAAQDTGIDISRFKLAVKQYLDKLAEEKKALFTLRFNEQMSIPQISTILNIPEGTVKSRLFYLLKEMKEELYEFRSLNIYP
jgi:RNA polymerase sigma-70 factor, ECF subfamily